MSTEPDPSRPNVILTPDSRLRVFISSTLKELAEEREVVRQSVLKLRLLPVMFEAGARPHPARELYQAYLSQSHVFVGIYWQSYGWVGPGMEISGLEDEFNLSSNLPRLIYVKSPAPDREPGLQRMLSRLQQENSASYKHFSSSSELGELIENDLALLLSESYEAASRKPAAEFTPRPLTNIPFPRNPLLGRTAELETVCNWLAQDEIGLVTLTGTGGTGKSRLALEAALELRSQFADGVFLVSLTPITDPARVIPTIAETLGVRETAQGRPVEDVLLSYLRGRRMLLVLDNFEQVMGAAPKVAQLLEACPRLKVVVTSRAPLRVRGEKELWIQPLPVPDLKRTSGLQQLSQYASVALFIQRAQSVRADFKVTDENAPAIAEICFRLDGLPLAIELAAARIRILTPQELLRRLSHRFDILRGGTRDLPERQQTLRGAIDWSYNLLTDPARALFRRLSVFAGGCSLEAAEAVCNLDGDLGFSVLEQVEALVDSSLLISIQGSDGQQRFGMLESLREYALERLAESGEEGRVRRLHAEYLLRFAEEVEPRIRSAERARWRSFFEQDLPNIRAVLDWSLSERDALEIGQRLTGNLAFFWALCGQTSEGKRYCEALLAAANENTPPAVRAGLRSELGGLTLLQGGTKSPVLDWDETIQMAREPGEKYVLANALIMGGAWALSSNDTAAAAKRLEECQRLCHETGDEWREALSTLWLGNAAALRGEAERSRELTERAIVLARHQGDPWLLIVPLIDVAQTAFAKGELDSAESTLREVEGMLRTVDDLWSLSWPLGALAQIELLRGDLAGARAHIAEALQTSREYGNMMSQIFSVVETAAALVLRYGREGTESGLRRQELMNAARLCGATCNFVDYPILLGSVVTRDVYDALVAHVRAAIEPEIWDPCFQEGTTIPFERALDIADAELREALT